MGNGDGRWLTSFGGRGSLSEGCGGWRGGSEFGLELTHGALQLCEPLGVFFGQVVQLLAKSGLPYKKRNNKNWRGEQRQPIDYIQ